MGPLLGGVVRSDDLGLGHHPVLVLGEGVAVWVEMEGVRNSELGKKSDQAGTEKLLMEVDALGVTCLDELTHECLK